MAVSEAPLQVCQIHDCATTLETYLPRLCFTCGPMLGLFGATSPMMGCMHIQRHVLRVQLVMLSHAGAPAWQFTQAKANDEIRWAVLNVISLLRRHQGVHDTLADAMASGQTVGSCVNLIERGLRTCEDI